MTGDTRAILIDAIKQKSDELKRVVPFQWQYPPCAQKNPVFAQPRKSWPVLPKDGRGIWKKNQKHWFYADVVFPEKQSGFVLNNTSALLYVNMWVPFTLWLEGCRLFKEDRPWKATGPIVDPHVFTIRSNRKYRLVLCVEPTEFASHGVIPTGLTIQSRTTLEQAVLLDAAVLQLALAEGMAVSSRERAVVERAFQGFDMAALKAENWPAVAKTLDAMDANLRPLSQKAKALAIHVIGHAHLDMDWAWTWRDTVHCLRRDFKAMTDLLADYPEVRFTHSQISTYETVQRTDPDVFQKIRRLIREGRWENAAATWVEGDLNMADGEAVARHVLYAADWSKKHLGRQARVLWEPDTFGHPGNMPQIAGLAECECYFHMRCNPGGRNNWAARLWTGIDGSVVPAFSLIYNGTLFPIAIKDVVLPQFATGANHALLFWGVGDHGGAMSRYQLHLLEMFRHKPLVPTLRFSTMAGFLDALKSARFKWPQNRAETFPIFEGCYTTHASVKRYNRACEGALLCAESLAAMAGLNRVDALREAWIPTLFNQFHDIIDGAAVHDSYKDADKRAMRSLREAGKVTEESLNRLVGCRNAQGGFLTVINPLGFDRTEPVRADLPSNTCCLLDDNGKIVPIQKLGKQFVFIAEDIPAFSSRTYRLLKDKPRDYAPPNVAIVETHAAVNAPTNTYKIETNSAIFHVSRDSGIICSFFDKSLKREWIPYGVPRYLTHTNVTRADLAMNVFQLVDESPNNMTAWLIRDIKREENFVAGARVKVLEVGPVFIRIRVAHDFRSSTLCEDMLFYGEYPRVDFDLRLLWREKGGPTRGVPQLKVGFTASMRMPRLRTEGPFTVMERQTDGQEQVTQKWAALSGDEGGITFYNDSRYGFDALGGRLRITLLRNAYGPDPDSDNGRHFTRFAVESHGPGRSAAEAMRRGMAFNRPLSCVLASDAARPIARLVGIPGDSSVVITALRRAEHSSGVLIRMFETSGKACRLKLQVARVFRAAQEINFLENPLGPQRSLPKGELGCSFRPFEIKTLLLKRRPDVERARF